MNGTIIEHPAQWPKPEQLQMEQIGQINGTLYCVLPITDSAISQQASELIAKSAVHLRVVSEIGRAISKDDLDKAGILIDDLQALCKLRKVRLQLKYLGTHATTARLYPEHCFIDENRMVQITFILCTKNFMIPRED